MPLCLLMVPRGGIFYFKFFENLNNGRKYLLTYAGYLNAILVLMSDGTTLRFSFFFFDKRDRMDH